MNDFRLSVLKPHYEELFNNCLLRNRWLDQISATAEQIVNFKDQYQAVEAQTTVPWWFVGILHYRDLNFQEAHLHNGDPLTNRTVNPPQGYPVTPPGNGYAYTFVESACDILRLRKFDVAKDRSIPAWLWRLEGWKGFGYASLGLNSEYLWNGTNHFGSGNNQGLILADGSFDPNGTSQQVGAAALVWYFHHQGMLSAQTQQHQQVLAATTSQWNMSVGSAVGGNGSFNYTTQATTVNVAVGSSASIQFFDVLQYYRKMPHQDEALTWLQQQLPADLLAEFARRWRSNPTPAPAPTLPQTVAAIAANTVGSTNVTPTVQVQPQTTDTVQLKVPYLSQLDNTLDPHGTCNVTSASMCMAYLGHPIRNAQNLQIEDELNQYCYDHGLDRHVPGDIAKVIRAYGYKDDFQPDAKWGDVKKWLAGGNPCIVHGWFTGSGHIIAIIGYNKKGWIVHDPYGEWYPEGYDTNRSGAGLTYSYEMMKRVCGTDGDLWIHYVSK